MGLQIYPPREFSKFFATFLALPIDKYSKKTAIFIRLTEKIPTRSHTSRSGYRGFRGKSVLLESYIGRVFDLLARIERQRYKYGMRATCRRQ